MKNYNPNLENLISQKLRQKYGTSLEECSKNQMYRCLCESIKEIMIEKYRRFEENCRSNESKKICYLSMEFLVGSSLKKTLFDLDLEEQCEQILEKCDLSIDELSQIEKDAGLGNGGLGRLAASYLDAIATSEFYGEGYSILYEYGFFKQTVCDGEQKELPDVWLDRGDVWLEKNDSKRVNIKIGGTISNIDGNEKYENYTELSAEAYDMYISGYHSEAVSLLRLWKSKPIDRFSTDFLVDGNFDEILKKRSESELVSMFLYPPDNTQKGKELRLVQQYFFVSATVQSVISDHYREHKTVENLADYVCFHINDTHPSLCIPEVVRVLCNDYGLSFEKAFNIVKQCISYTNHTVMPEALEVWDEDMVKKLLPPIYRIIKDINKLQFPDIYELSASEWDKISNISVISSGKIRMANLSVLCSNKVNGVSALHSDILKNELFYEFSQKDPEKFINITNGISYRRWLCIANKRLSSILDDVIGTEYRERPYELSSFSSYHNDRTVLQMIEEARYKNKTDLSNTAKKLIGCYLDPDSMFDVQVKRLHEYKRQLLNVLKILSYYCEIRSNVNSDIYPKTFIFAAKAAPTYHHAKRIIKLINKVSQTIDADALVRKYLKVVFLPDYNVSLAERIIPAADLSEQISLAGKEASGTGNMKFMLNGALTVGTYDGANIEISELVGEDNIYIFGMRAQNVQTHINNRETIEEKLKNDARLSDVIKLLSSGMLGDDFSDIADYLCKNENPDPYGCIEDYSSYMKTYRQACIEYKNRKKHFSKSVINTANAGYFASDRAIEEYASKIWGITRVKS